MELLKRCSICNEEKYKNHFQASKDLGISVDMISKILIFKCYNKYGIIYEADYNDGFLPNYSNIKKGSSEVIDITTNIIYNSIRQACRELGLSNSTQSTYLKNKNYNKTNLRYV